MIDEMRERVRDLMMEGLIGYSRILVFILLYACMRVQSVQLCVTLWAITHQASSVLENLQARILEWVAIPFSRGSSQPRDGTWVSCIAGRFFTV